MNKMTWLDLSVEIDAFEVVTEHHSVGFLNNYKKLIFLALQTHQISSTFISTVFES